MRFGPKLMWSVVHEHSPGDDSTMRSGLYSGIKKLLPHNSFSRSVITIAGGTGLAQLITVLVVPIVTRLYTPTHFGILGIYDSALALLLVLASWRYELAVPLAENDSTAIDLLGLCFVILLGMTVLLSLVLLFAGEQITVMLGVGSFLPYVWWLPLGLLGGGTYQTLNYWALRKRAFSRIARTKISQSVGSSITQLVFAALHQGPIGLILGDIIGVSSGSSTLASQAWRNDKESIKSLSFKGMLRAAGKYRRFPIFTAGSAFMNRAGLQLPVIVFAALYGSQAAGFFILTRQVLALPAALVGQAVGQVYYGTASALVRDNPSALPRLLYGTVRNLVLIGFVPISLVAIIGPRLFAIVFGASWSTSGEYVRFLGVMLLMQLAIAPISQSLNILERQDLQLGWDTFMLVLSVGSLLISNRLHYSPSHAIGIYSASMVIAYLAYLYLCKYALSHDSKYKYNTTGSTVPVK